MMKVAIIGAGTMGCSLAALFLSNDFDVVVKTRRKDANDKIREKVLLYASKIKSPLSATLLVSNEFDAIKNCEFIVEAVEENLAAKKKILVEVEAANSNAIICTNTSSLSVTELSTALANPTKFAGMHFFNPAHKMQLVEIIKTPNTSTQTVEAIVNVATSLGKTPVVVADSPGFIVNRLLVPFLLDAIKLYESGVADFKDIDSAVKLGLNHPMGPFELLDLIGLDVVVAIAQEFQNRSNSERFAIPKLVLEMIKKGKLGRKTKVGFYNYS